MTGRNGPPKTAERLFRLLFPDGGAYSTIGDIEEAYRSLADELGPAAAGRWYWGQLFAALPSWLLRQLDLTRNYATTFLRIMLRQKIYTAINVTGMAVGMACFVLITLWIADERSYDSYHEHADRVYRVLASSEKSTWAATFGGLGPALERELPEVLESARVASPSTRLIRRGDLAFHEEGFTQADPSIFDILSFTFLEGSPESALTDPSSIVITESIARRYFGTGSPIGGTLLVNERDEYTVTAVIEDPPPHTHLQARCLIQFEPIGRFVDIGWDLYGWYNYLLLAPGASAETMDEKVTACARRHADGIDDVRFSLQPLARIHLHSEGIEFDFVHHGDVRYVYIFLTIAVLTLAIACINYMNLATTRAACRSREIGMRKVFGATRADITKQFIGETVMQAFLALVMSVILVELALPLFNGITGKELHLAFTAGPGVILKLVLLTAATGLAAGSYPAVRLSSLGPVETLREVRDTEGGGAGLRRLLVVIQFSITVTLLIAAGVVIKQMHFIRHKDLGFDGSRVIYTELEGRTRERYVTFKSMIEQIPGVQDVTAGFVPISPGSWTAPWWEGKPEGRVISMFRSAVDADYLDFFRMRLAEGRFFNGEIATDTIHYVLNEAAVEAMGIESPIGTRFSIGGTPGTVIGVVRNFHFRTLHDRVEPFIFYYKPRDLWRICIRIDGTRIPETISRLDRAWEEFEPRYPFQYHFLGDVLEQMYASERRLGGILTAFAAIAVFISCLGLFGLASHMAARRTREIGIRKALGASTRSVLALMLRDFGKWLAISNAIALPVGLLVMRNWLDGYAYRTDVGWAIPLAAACLSLFVALATVTVKSMRAAGVNPSDAMRYE